jgi:3-oxoacyl-[acyl-carrier-protein] synthase II
MGMETTTANRRRVVITGMGIVSPVGADLASFWRSLLEGKSGIRRIQAFDPSELKSPNAAEVDNGSLTAALEALDIKPQDRTVDLAQVASAQALEQAGLIAGRGPYAPQPVAVIFGTGNGPTHTQAEGFAAFAAKGHRGPRPTAVPRSMINAVSAQVSLRYRLTGANYIVAAACTSSTLAIGIAFRMIRDGYIRQALCGGAESLIDYPIYTAWNNLGVMSRQADPAQTARPFDRDRSGFVMGEGAGALLLESLESAQTRGARLRGEIRGYGESSDAAHITHPDAEGQAAAMRAALADAHVVPEEVGYINAHGTGTKANDECESRAIRLVYGPAADRIPVGSNKSFFGHMMGAAGIVETIATALSLEAGLAPPNLNLENPDPACALHLIGAHAVPITKPVAMKNSFGFGGSNAVLVLRRAE